MSDPKHSKVLNEDKLRYACKLMKQIKGTDPLLLFTAGLEILQFGNIPIQDFLDWIDSTGGET